MGDGGMATVARRPDVDIGKCNLVMQISIQPSWLPLLCVTIRAGNEASRSFHNHGEDPLLGSSPALVSKEMKSRFN